MKPIARTMAAALSAAALIAATGAAAGARKGRVTPAPSTGQRQTIVSQADGFVIRVSMLETQNGTPQPLAQSRLIPIGADVHLDARLLTPGEAK